MTQEQIEAQFANACDREDRDALKRVAKRASEFAGELTYRGKYAEAMHVRTIAATARERCHKMRNGTFSVVHRRRYMLVAEQLGDGPEHRTARWFHDHKTDTWYVAESWKRPNLRRMLNAEQRAYVESLPLEGGITVGQCTVVFA